MRAVIVLIFWTISILLPSNVECAAPVVIPPMPHIDPISESDRELIEWDEYHAEAMAEYSDEFTALFNSYETKWSKNGRLMMRNGDSGSFKFVAKGK